MSRREPHWYYSPPFGGRDYGGGGSQDDGRCFTREGLIAFCIPPTVAQPCRSHAACPMHTPSCLILMQREKNSPAQLWARVNAVSRNTSSQLWARQPPTPKTHGLLVWLDYEAHLREAFCVMTAQPWLTCPLTPAWAITVISTGAVTEENCQPWHIPGDKGALL